MNEALAALKSPTGCWLLMMCCCVGRAHSESPFGGLRQICPLCDPLKFKRKDCESDVMMRCVVPAIALYCYDTMQSRWRCSHARGRGVGTLLRY